MSQPRGLPKNRFCERCDYHRLHGVFCQSTRRVSEWVKDAHGQSRTVSGGVCVKVEDYYPVQREIA